MRNTKAIIEEYGKAILGVAVGLLIFGILWSQSWGNEGIFGTMSAQAHSNVDNNIREKNQLFEKQAERADPVISFLNPTIRAGRLFEWSTLFEARDADGKQLEFQIISVNGKAVTGNDYTFPVSGIYQVEIWVEDNYGMTSHQIVNIPVQHIPFGKEVAG